MILGAVIGTLIGLAASYGGISGSEGLIGIEKKVEQKKYHDYTIGDKVNLAGISYQVTKVTTQKSQIFEKAAGKYIVVYMTIENLRNVPVNVIEGQFGIIDDKGRLFTTASNYYSLEGEVLYNVVVQPNLPIDRRMAFDVPFDENLGYKLIIVVDPSDEHGEKAIIKLGMGRDFS